MTARSLALPPPYCLLSVLISRPPFSHLKEIVLLDPPPSTSFLPSLPSSVTPSLPRLSSCSSAPEEDCGSWQREKQYKQSGANIKCSSFSGARLSYRCSPACRNQTRLMCFSVPASHCTAYEGGSFLPTFHMADLYLYVFYFTQLPASPGSASV